MKEKNSQNLSSKKTLAKLKKTSLCLFQLVMIIWNFSIFITIANVAVTFSRTKIKFDAVIQNVESEPILNIKGVKTSKCPDGYTTLLKLRWPGTKKFCNCSYKGDPYSYKLGECSDRDKKNNCRDTPAIKTIGMETLHKKHIICAKRLKNQSMFKNSDSMLDDGTCKPGTKLCGATFKNPQYGICIPDSEPNCPITEVAISKKNPNPKIFTKNENFDGENQIWMTSEGKNGVLADFLIGEQAICTELENVPRTNRKIGYPSYMMKDFTNYCDLSRLVINPRLKSLGPESQIELSNLLDWNNVPRDKLPGYPKPSSIFELFPQKFLPFEPRCRKNLANIVIGKRRALLMTGALLWFSILVFLSTIVVGITIPCIKIRILLCGPKKLSHWNYKLIENLIWLKWGMKLPQFPLFLLCIYLSWSVKIHYKKLATGECLAFDPGNQFQEMQEGVEKQIFKRNLKAFFMFFLLLIYDFGLFWYMKNKKKDGERMTVEDDLELDFDTDEGFLKSNLQSDFEVFNNFLFLGRWEGRNWYRRGNRC